MFDLYQQVTDRIISSLEKGVVPWEQPWSGLGGYPRNGYTRRPYHGINTLLLMIEADSKGYDSQNWYTFNNVKTLRASIKKGEHSTMIVYYEMRHTKTLDWDTREEVIRSFPYLKYWWVFNECQTTIQKLKRDSAVFAPVETIEQMVNRTGAVIVSGNKAAYFPKTDKISMPEKIYFKTKNGYYSTLLHELTHWTGHESRLDRPNKNFFGSDAYAKEELVAEMGSAFLCAEYLLDKEQSMTTEGGLTHASYISSWIDVLRGDRKLIFGASSHARKAVELLLGREEKNEKESAERTSAYSNSQA